LSNALDALKRVVAIANSCFIEYEKEHSLTVLKGKTLKENLPQLGRFVKDAMIKIGVLFLYKKLKKITSKQ